MVEELVVCSLAGAIITYWASKGMLIELIRRHSAVSAGFASLVILIPNKDCKVDRNSTVFHAMFCTWA